MIDLMSHVNHRGNLFRCLEGGFTQNGRWASPTTPKRVYSADIRRETFFSLSLSSFFARVLVLVLVARFDSWHDTWEWNDIKKHDTINKIKHGHCTHTIGLRSLHTDSYTNTHNNQHQYTRLNLSQSTQ